MLTKCSEGKLSFACVQVIYMLVWRFDIIANEHHSQAIVPEIQTLNSNINLENYLNTDVVRRIFVFQHKGCSLSADCHDLELECSYKTLNAPQHDNNVDFIFNEQPAAHFLNQTHYWVACLKSQYEAKGRKQFMWGKLSTKHNISALHLDVPATLLTSRSHRFTHFTAD